MPPPEPGSGRGWHNAGMLLQKYWAIFNPLDAQEAEREIERLHPERETLLLAAAGAAKVLGPDHRATKAFAKAAATMDRVDLWRARLAMKTLRKDQREAIAAAAGLPGLYGPAEHALTTAIDLAHGTKLRQVDDHVAVAGMQANPGQDTVRLVPASGALFLVIDPADFRRVHVEAIQLRPNLRLAEFLRSRSFGRQGWQKKNPEREADSEYWFHCEIFSRAQPIEAAAHDMITHPKAQECAQTRGKQQ